MRNIYILLIGLAIFSLNNLNAQEFPWPDLGEAKVIEPDFNNPGALNDAIMGDTTETGERNHYHYILKRGATYTYTSRINNVGWPLIVTTEDGDGDLPFIQPIKPIGEDEAPRPFHCQGDFYIDGIRISGWDTDQIPTDNATIRLAADSITVVVKNVLFDFNRQNAIRINADACSLYVENSIFGDQGVSEQMWAGFTFNYRANSWPLAIIRNNTFYNHHNSIINMYGDKTKYGKLIFEHNTIVNAGTQGCPLGRPDTLIFKNNLWVNTGILGDGREGDRDNFAMPAYAFSLDTNFVDTTQTTWEDPVIEFENNHFYNDPALFAFLPDSSDKMTETFFNPYLADRVDSSTTIIKEEAFVGFTNFALDDYDAYQEYIMDFYEFDQDPVQLPNFGIDIATVDFGYANTSESYSAGSDGKPLGDLNWFADIPNSVTNNVTQQLFKVYPNPVQNLLKVKFNDEQNVDKIVISNILGQNVMSKSNIRSKEITIDTKHLKTGIYFVNFYYNESFLGTRKILKK